MVLIAQLELASKLLQDCRSVVAACVSFLNELIKAGVKQRAFLLHMGGGGSVLKHLSTC